MSRTITFIPVSTAWEEAAVLDRLCAIEQLFGTEVLPIFEQQLWSRLITCASTHGITVQSRPFVDCLAVPAGRSDEGHGSDRPGHVLASDGVDESVASLAAGLCHTTAVRLSQSSAQTCSAAGGYALVLINPEATSSSILVSTLRSIREANGRCGLVFATDPLDARFFILKVLLVPSAESHGVNAIASYGYEPGLAPSSPELLPEPYARGPETMLDALMLHGHSNALDFFLGPGTVLCARKDVDRTAELPARLFPCFHDGKCFRQRLWKRSPLDETGLVGISQTPPARLVLLSGCNLVSLGPSWFSTMHSLAYQSAHTDTIAVITAAGLSAGSLEIDLLCLALIMDGMALGDVVEKVNTVRSDVYGEAPAIAKGCGPLVLIGNPCFRFVGGGCQDVEAVRLSSSSFAVDLAAITMSDNGAAFVRVRVPGDDRGRYFIVAARPRGTECAGIAYESDGFTTLFVWIVVGLPLRGEHARLEVQRYESDPYEPAAVAADACLSQVGFWTLLLEFFRDTLSAVGVSTQCIQTAYAALPQLAARLSRGAAGARSRPYVLAVDSAKRHVLFREIWPTMARMSELLLESVLAFVKGWGTLISWEQYFIMREKIGPLGPCACAEGIVWGQRFTNGVRDRVSYQCNICGSIGDDDGRRLVRIASLSRNAASGAAITCLAEIRAPRGETLHVDMRAVLETWIPNEAAIGERWTGLVEDSADVRLSVTAPSGLGRGAYSFYVFGTVNGAFFCARHLVVVDESRSASN